MEEQRYYAGDPLEAGGTSIAGGAAPAIKALYGRVIKHDAVVLDYGAGKFARNADWLREQGTKVYAYDPFNGTSADGWEHGNVSSRKPKGKFDLVFTSYVLNVVPKHVEESIIETTLRYAKHAIHIVRNRDVIAMVREALNKRDRYVYPFFVNEYNNGKVIEPDKITEKMILSFCKFGVQTSRGFQRLTDLHDYGFREVRSTEGYKVYEFKE